jgi:hypothetical protein
MEVMSVCLSVSDPVAVSKQFNRFPFTFDETDFY